MIIDYVSVTIRNKKPTVLLVLNYSFVDSTVTTNQPKQRDFVDLPPSEAECVMSNFSFLLFIAETATILWEIKDLSDGKAKSARETIYARRWIFDRNTRTYY